MWLKREAILSSLTDLNLQCLELMAEQGRVDGTRDGVVLFQEVNERWGALDAEARRRAASCPFLLVDAGFGDPNRWHSRDFAVQVADTRAFFTVERCLIVARQVFLYAWHLSNSQKPDGRILLGMSPGSVDALRSYSLPRVIEVAEHSTDCICPRWPHLIEFWRELLLAAESGEFVALEAAKMHGLTLLAANIRSASFRVKREADITNGNVPFPCEIGGTLYDQTVGRGRAFPRKPSGGE